MQAGTRRQWLWPAALQGLARCTIGVCQSYSNCLCIAFFARLVHRRQPLRLAFMAFLACASSKIGVHLDRKSSSRLPKIDQMGANRNGNVCQIPKRSSRVAPFRNLGNSGDNFRVPDAPKAAKWAAIWSSRPPKEAKMESICTKNSQKFRNGANELLRFGICDVLGTIFVSQTPQKIQNGAFFIAHIANFSADPVANLSVDRAGNFALFQSPTSAPT